MGIVSLSDAESYEICFRNRRFVKQNLPSYGILGMLRRPSKGGLLKIDMDCMELWDRNMTSAKLLHCWMSTCRANLDIIMPYGFQQFCHWQIDKALPEFLISLYGENDFQVFLFHPVVEEAVVTNFLESGRKHMHQVVANELGVRKRDFPPAVARLLSSCGESRVIPRNELNPAVGNRNLMCVPAKVFNCITKAVEGLFYVGTPVLLIKSIFPLLVDRNLKFIMTGDTKIP